MAAADDRAGIDVQAELKTKEDSSHHGKPTLTMSTHLPTQRAVINRHHQIPRGAAINAPRLLQAQRSRTSVSSQSPQLQPTPSSQTSSPTASSISPPYAISSGMTSPHGSMPPQPPLQQQQQQQQQQRQPPPLHPPRSTSFPQLQIYPGPSMQPAKKNIQSMTSSPVVGQAGGGRKLWESRSGHWPSPYQTHIEQLGKLPHPFLSFCIL